MVDRQQIEPPYAKAFKAHCGAHPCPNQHDDFMGGWNAALWHRELNTTPAPSHPIEYGRKHTDGSRSGGQPPSTMYPRTYLECSVKDFGATPDAPSQHSELATYLYQAAYVMKSEASKQANETYKSAMMKCEHNIREAARLLRQPPSDAMPIVLKIAAASDEHEMWERRYTALCQIYPIERIFADQCGKWGLRDFLAYSAKSMGFAALTQGKPDHA